MKPRYKNVMTMFGVAVLAIGLAACGGSSKKTTPTDEDCPDGQELNADGVCVDTGDTAEGPTATLLMAHQEAAGATKDAEAAGMAAEQAVEDAVEAGGMLDAQSVKGDSATARMNAEMVLAARAAVDQAVMDAEAARTRAVNAEAAVMALPEGTEGRMLALDALADAIEAVDEQIAAAKAIQTGKNADETDNTDGQNLKLEVEKVTGTNEDEPETPGDVADGVATAVASALGPTATDNGAALRLEHYSTNALLTAATPPAIMDRTFHATDSAGMTWAMIVGEDNITMERLGAGEANVPLASIAGMKNTAVDRTATTVLTSTGGPYNDGTAYGAASVAATRGTEYMGIPGAVWCLGGSEGCSVATDGTLSDGWYFTPTSSDTIYIVNPTPADRENTPYVADIGYVSWGHWLTAAAGVVTVHTYAFLQEGGNTAGLDLAEDTGENPVNTATYSGSAAGMSVHRTFDGNGAQMSIDSGAFTADVSLTATFAGTTAAPTAKLKGTVDNFQGGAHADSGWSVELEETDLTAAGNFGDDGATPPVPNLGVAQGSGQGDDSDGQAGVWTTQGHGEADKRPAGFFGNFEAHFTDGHASGVYAAARDEED